MVGARALYVVVMGCSITACSDTTLTVRGTITDAQIGKPIANAQVVAGELETVTNGRGRFTLADVDKETTLSVSKCGFDDADIAVSEEPLRIAIEPVLVKGTLTSNLTQEGLRGSVTAGERRTRTEKDGSFTLHAICGDKVRVTAEGYAATRVHVPAATSSLEIELAAGPAVTLRQQIEWESRSQFEKSWDLVHPDAHNYVTKEDWIAEQRQSLNEGYTFVSVDIKEVNFVRWVFTACEVDEFGPKTYPKTAALRIIYHEAGPDGTLTDIPAVIHFVQTEDKKWRFFPLVGCTFEPSA